MSINKYVSKIFVSISLILILYQKGYSQKPDNTDLISVTLRIVAEGNTQYYKENNSGYFAIATVTNIQDTTISFWIMTCSWPDVNWVASSDSVYFGSHGCDSNFPEKVELLPHKSINFYGVFTKLSKKPMGKSVKLGFVYFNSFNDIFEASAERSKIKNFRKYWSNQVVLEDNLFKYQKD